MDTPSRPCKILVISDYRSLVSSRPEAEIFIRLASLGHTIHVITYPGATYYTDRFLSKGITVWETHPEKKFSWPWMRYLRKLVLDQQYDIVHAFNSKALTNAVWALSGLKTTLVAYRGYAGQTHWYDPTMYLKYFHPRVDFIWCVSRDIEDILARNMPWAKQKLFTIPKGHDPAWYGDIRPVDRHALGFTKDDILVSFVANVRPFKGLSYLLEATHLIDAGIPLHFLFMGNGYDRKAIREQMDRSPLKDRFHLLGYRTDAAAVVAATDCLILTSTHGEGLAKSIVEAMSIGIAPIITDIPGNEGLVIDGLSGWVIPPKDPKAIAEALTGMASDATERKRRGQHALEHIRTQFHIDQTVKAFASRYQDILSSSK